MENREQFFDEHPELATRFINGVTQCDRCEGTAEQDDCAIVLVTDRPEILCFRCTLKLKVETNRTLN